jgi:two-component system cell cycle sensor histidine kinase/response regulator CckA
VIQKILGALVTPAADVRDTSDQRRARLLASILLTLLALGCSSGLLQLTLVPGFLPTFVFMLGALALIGVAYVLSRTRHFRKAAWGACAAPIAACFAVIIVNPDDIAAGPFMLLGVLLASTFLDARATSVTALGAFSALGAALLLQDGPVEPARALPLLAFHAVMSPLFVVATVHRDGLERLREVEGRKRDATLQQQRQLETLGRLAGGIAHDFNNLLLVVQANAELIDRARVPRVGPFTADILEAASRGADLTRQILATARKQLLQPQRVPLNALLTGVESLLRRLMGSHITLIVQTTDVDAAVLADRTQLEQVLLNLALNARDAMPNGGVLKLGASRRVPSAGQRQPASEWICLSVVDTGVGMDADTQRRIFEPFFTTKGVNGHGLGLATVRGIVEQSGGSIEVTSSPNQGARFDLYLPLVGGPAVTDPKGSEPPAAAHPSRRSATILVLDDDGAVLRAVGHMLEAMGHQALLACSVGEAIDLFEREQARVDLLLCDLLIPAMSGVEVATLLLRRRPTLRVLFMSGYADWQADALRAMPSAGLMAKPFSSDELRARIERSLPGDEKARSPARHALPS